MAEIQDDRLALLIQRVDVLEAERTIAAVLARYGHTADTCQDEAYIDLFTDDAVLDLKFDVDTPGEDQVYVGKDEIRRFITRPNEHHRPGFYGRSMHLMGNNLAISVRGDTAFAESYNVTLQKTQDGIAFVAAGNNHWRFAKVEGEWKISLRRRREMGTDAYCSNVAQEVR